MGLRACESAHTAAHMRSLPAYKPCFCIVFMRVTVHAAWGHPDAHACMAVGCTPTVSV